MGLAAACNNLHTHKKSNDLFCPRIGQSPGALPDRFNYKEVLHAPSTS